MTLEQYFYQLFQVWMPAFFAAIASLTGPNPLPIPAQPVWTPAPIVIPAPPPPVVTPPVVVTPPPTTTPPANGCQGTAPHPGDICWQSQWWIARTSNGLEGPGPNIWTSQNVSIQPDGLHLKANGQSSEVISENQYGYGTYTWDVNIPALDPNVALSLFTWSDDPAYNHREIDFESARWGWAGDPTNSQFVVQPYTIPANIKRFTLPSGQTTVSFNWQPNKVTFSAGGQAWEYTGSSIPQPSAHVHMNLWAYAQNHQNNEVVISNFKFTP